MSVTKEISYCNGDTNSGIMVYDIEQWTEIVIHDLMDIIDKLQEDIKCVTHVGPFEGPDAVHPVHAATVVYDQILNN